MKYRWWTNFGEDGAWPFWLHVLRNCWRGHTWHYQPEYEDNGYNHVLVEEWEVCSGCGSWRRI